MRNPDSSLRQASHSYTISVADTWEHKILVFDGDTSAGFNDDNNQSMQLYWWLDGGSNFQVGSVSDGAWGAQNNSCFYAGADLDIAQNTANDWAFTGVQMLAGEYSASTLPPFQFDSYGDNLLRCQRYFTMYAEGAQAPVGNGLFWEAAEVMVTCHLPTTMRLEPPTIYQTTGTDYYFLYRNGAADGITELTLNASSSPNAITIYLNSATNGLASDTKNRPCILRAGSASAKFGLDAEM